MSRKLLQWMTLAFLLSGCTSGEDFGYIVYKGENHISETESFLIYVFLQNFEQSAQKEQLGHVQFYAKQLEGNINYPVTYYCSGTGSISIYKDGALYMTGSFSGNGPHSTIDATFTGPVQPLWDEYAVSLGWSDRILLEWD